MTVLLIELLIIGGEFALLVVAGYAWYIGVDLTAVTIDKDVITPLAIATTAALYPLGIVWSRISDLVWSRLDSRARERVFAGEDPALRYHRALVLVLARSDKIAEGLSQVRSVYRVARATGTSCLLGAIMLACAAHRLNFLTTHAEVASVFLLTLVGASSVQAWYHLRSHYLLYVAHASTVLEPAGLGGISPKVREPEESTNG